MEPAMERITFALAQYTPDLLRQEPRNIGIFVADRHRVLARFIGEDATGLVVPKSIPPHFFNDVDLYLDWHDYWSNLLSNYSTEAVASAFLHAQVIRNRGKAFSVVYGGEYEPRDELSPEEILSRLFDRLVLSPASRSYDPRGAAREYQGGYLGRRLAHEFRRLGILENADAPESLFVRHPVRVRVPVTGTNPVPHTPDFYQENGERYVMEQVDFSIQTLARARDRAMYSQYMLTDIVAAAEKQSNAKPPLNPIAIVNRISTKDNTIQEYALAALSNVPSLEIVYWDRDEERRRFLEERRAVAEVQFNAAKS
jgi:hypothetical protein